MATRTQTTDLHQFNPTYLSASNCAEVMGHQPDKVLRVIRMKQLVERTGLSRATLYTLIATDSTFPKKIMLSARSIGYLEFEVEAWIMARAASSVAA